MWEWCSRHRRHGNGNGVIEGSWNSTDQWGRVRTCFGSTCDWPVSPPVSPTSLAATDYQPRNAVGGIVGIQSAAPFTGMTGGTYYVCSTTVLGKFVKQLDIQLDDGDTATGAMRAGTALPAAIATASIDDATPYIVCMGI
jgi:hypothetical protein